MVNSGGVLWFQVMLLIYGMVIDLVQKQSDVEGVLVQPVLITAVWCGSGEHLTIVCIADGAYCVFFFVWRNRNKCGKT